MSEEQFPAVSLRRVSPTIVELIIPCEMHRDHRALIVSEDDTAEVIGGVIARFVRDHGYGVMLEQAEPWDDLPF